MHVTGKGFSFNLSVCFYCPRGYVSILNFPVEYCGINCDFSRWCWLQPAPRPQWRI